MKQMIQALTVKLTSVFEINEEQNSSLLSCLANIHE